MAPPILSLALPSETGRVLSIQSHTVQVAQATSSQMSKCDPFRPFMNIIDNMLHKMLMEDPSFKPQGGRFGENDMDYDTDEKSMAMLIRRLRIAREQYCRYRSSWVWTSIEHQSFGLSIWIAAFPTKVIGDATRKAQTYIQQRILGAADASG